jgi:hypothetical protein
LIGVEVIGEAEPVAVLAGRRLGFGLGFLVAVLAEGLVAIEIAELVAVRAVLPVGKWVLELVGKLVARQAGVPMRQAELQDWAPGRAERRRSGRLCPKNQS